MKTAPVLNVKYSIELWHEILETIHEVLSQNVFAEGDYWYGLESAHSDSIVDINFYSCEDTGEKSISIYGVIREKEDEVPVTDYSKWITIYRSNGLNDNDKKLFERWKTESN